MRETILNRSLWNLYEAVVTLRCCCLYRTPTRLAQMMILPPHLGMTPRAALMGQILRPKASSVKIHAAYSFPQKPCVETRGLDAATALTLIILVGFLFLALKFLFISLLYWSPATACFCCSSRSLVMAYSNDICGFTVDDFGKSGFVASA